MTNMMTDATAIRGEKDPMGNTAGIDGTETEIDINAKGCRCIRITGSGYSGTTP